MSRLTRRIAAALVASAAIIGGSFVVSDAADGEPTRLDSCRVALRHADHVHELDAQISGGIAALSIAQEYGMKEKVREIRRELQANQRTHHDAATMYEAAAAECRR